ncbi:MAG TPA: type II toxin-antitoxin system PemK/MazF family toxin [Candidatus Methylomirabilis sp.]|nr:type II toxin-antitoxin system PemK/MazF family toxin [Candidatus Methylomirabilis sp.]
MIAYRRGDVVLVGFQFADDSGWKHRPAVVVSSAAYHRSRQEIIVAAITSNVTRVLYGDHVLAGWKEAGLLFPSVVTGILRTIKAAMVHRTLGSVRARELTTIDRTLRAALGLDRKV